MLATVAALLAIPAASFAYSPTDDDDLTCVPGADDTVECVAGVFDEDVECVYETDTGESGAGTTDGNGEFDFVIDAPEDGNAVDATVECGPQVLNETIVADDGQVDAAPAEETVASDVIPNTGFDSATLLGIGLAALVLGGGALAAGRQRRDSVDA